MKGHSGHDGNERCDLLANEAIAKIKKAHTPAQLQAALARFQQCAEAESLVPPSS